MIASTTQSQTLFTENYDTQTLGVNPTGFTVNLPATPTPGTLETTVVAFGGGQGLQLLDQGAGNAQVQQDFTASSSVHMSFSFARNQNITPANATSGLFVSLGTYGQNQPTLASRNLAIKLFNDGTFGFERGTQTGGGAWVANVTSVQGTYEAAGGSFGTHTMDIYAYAGTTGGSGISYIGPDAQTYALSAKSYSVFLDGVLVTAMDNSLSSGVYGFTSAAGYSDPADMGRFGFVTGGATSRVGMDFTVDNMFVEGIQVMPVPEPSTTVLVGLGLAAFGVLVKRKRS
jgi:hypothetical protein